jgi:poly(hydroxyalkanoate) depolymerase family esterase
LFLKSTSARSHAVSAFDLSRAMHRLPRLLVGGTALLAILLLPSAPKLAHARGGIWQEFVYTGPAGSRPYFVYTPANYQPGMPVPLIFMLHGCTQNAVNFAAGTRMDELADAHQFIVVYPQQTTLNNPTTCWNWFASTNQVRGSGEPAILAGIVETVEHDSSRWTIDRSRVFVAGASAGAVMSIILGATYPDLFAAIGVVAGVEYPAGATSTDGLDPLQAGEKAYQAMGPYARVVPTINFQGTADPFVAPINGDLVVQQWMETNRLASQGRYDPHFANPTRVITGDPPLSHPYIKRSWNDSFGQEVQEYWVAVGASHAWTGGSLKGTFTDPLGPSISQILYGFFLNHPISMNPESASYQPSRRTSITTPLIELS